MLRGTLLTLRSHIARNYDDRRDAQPGKVLHQRVLGPLALLGTTPFLAYYGDYSAPALFLIGVAWDLAQTGDLAFFRSIRGDVLSVLEWMDRDGDSYRDGFYEYRTRAGEKGLKNQGWKDSDEAILYPDGRLVSEPIAVCEIQGLYYASKQALALAFACDGDHARSSALLEQATALKRRFNERFWMPEERYFAVALGPDKRQVRSIAGNPGACLAYGIIDADKASFVIDRLLAPDMFSGWGIRTLSTQHPAYNPFAYHLGSVWPFANAITARGFQRYGAMPALHHLAEALFSATRLFAHDRLPEVFGGNPRDATHPHPGLYPGGCSPQAWSAASIISLIGALLGITPLAPRNAIVVDPHLPAWLPDVTLRDISIGTERVSLRFRRKQNGDTDCEVLEQSGNIQLVRLAPCEREKDRLARAFAAFA
jgi:glycogen debranching enzyme